LNELGGGLAPNGVQSYGGGRPSRSDRARRSFRRLVELHGRFGRPRGNGAGGLSIPHHLGRDPFGDRLDFLRIDRRGPHRHHHAGIACDRAWAAALRASRSVFCPSQPV
jgi:hypothetical protein